MHIDFLGSIEGNAWPATPVAEAMARLPAKGKRRRGQEVASAHRNKAKHQQLPFITGSHAEEKKDFFRGICGWVARLRGCCWRRWRDYGSGFKEALLLLRIEVIQQWSSLLQNIEEETHHHPVPEEEVLGKPIQLRGQSSRSLQLAARLACTTAGEWFTFGRACLKYLR
jgi:hypothetical protein